MGKIVSRPNHETGKLLGTKDFPAHVQGDITLKGSNVTQAKATIANGASISNVIDLETKTLVGIHMPALWTVANLTFQVSEDGVTYDNLYDRFGNEVSYSVAQSRFISIPPADWIGIRFIKVRSGTVSVPVNQGALRDIVLVARVV